MGNHKHVRGEFIDIDSETVEVFTSKKGNKFLTKESAISDSITHETCEYHGIEYLVYAKCPLCRERKLKESYSEKQKKRWDEVTPIYDDLSDRYFFSMDDLTDYLDHESKSVDDMFLYLCEPCHLSEVDEDFWEDDWYDGASLPDEIQIALDKLNEAIRLHGKSFSWFPSNQAVSVKI